MSTRDSFNDVPAKGVLLPAFDEIDDDRENPSAGGRLIQLIQLIQLKMTVAMRLLQTRSARGCFPREKQRKTRIQRGGPQSAPPRARRAHSSADSALNSKPKSPRETANDRARARESKQLHERTETRHAVAFLCPDD